MDIISEHSKLETKRSKPISVVMLTMLGIVLWLDWFFTLTDEDRLLAGINLDGEGHNK
jgi:hypothetical protein